MERVRLAFVGAIAIICLVMPAFQQMGEFVLTIGLLWAVKDFQETAPP